MKSKTDYKTQGQRQNKKSSAMLAKALILAMSQMLLLAAAATQAQAQESSNNMSATSPSTSTTTGVSTLPVNPQATRPYSIQLDATAAILDGFGVVLSRDIAEKFSAGVFYSQYVLDSDDTISFFNEMDSENDVKEYGAQVTFTPTNKIYETGLYFSAGVTQTEVKSDVTYRPFFSTTTSRSSAKADEFGGFAKIGYQFFSTVASNFHLVARIGAGYGSSSKITVKREAGKTTTELSDGFVLDGAVGVTF